MIHSVLHHFESVGHLVGQGQVQNDRTDKSCEHDGPLDFAHYHNIVRRVVFQLIEDHEDERHLEDENQDRIKREVYSFLMLDLELALLVL